ncbi:hypothetical protein LTR02_001729 [Friedmanniomyces endolithicus]|nr:hypothetical protein LTR75_001015 [Friedmanniomyces endolithicus]KAK0823816.1 hypothetical protein LTR03_017867 [Friedmanniomyces endolithicus]KAK0854515.1 hypothetical protein LTS02_011470 [Friedmanniomyces endolithicus]KAK0875712.1 hypothetical protein LTR87_010497 [Friedmanniomyces endolithicus]KAK0914631.1 hypothetical protein LTR02_001729 [Friedmanniomyces endolithicus]
MFRILRSDYDSYVREGTNVKTETTYGGSETDEPATPEAILTRQPSQDVGDRQNALPTLSHRLRHTSSILAIVLSDEEIFAGTQGGEILVYSLSTFERKAVIEGHRGSVLGLCLSQDAELLFSSAGDRIVNVWNTIDLTRNCCLYSSYDVGDLFCVSYSASLQTAYLGAQNTTIQWCSLKDWVTKSSAPRKEIHPSVRDDRFFDSAGPGGVRTPRRTDADLTPRHARGGDVIQIGKENVEHFAHYGYVYCMQLIKDGVPESAGNEVLITGGGDGVVKLWKLDAKRAGAVEELYSLDDGREEGHSILSIAVDGTFIYSGRSGGEVDVWDTETRQLMRNLKAHRDDVLTICVGGGFMFSAAVTGYVRKFDRQYQLKSRLKAHEGRILASAFTYHRHRPIYVTGGNDCTLGIWDISDCLSPTVTATRTSNEQLFESLRRFVSYRTVSSDPKYQVDCRRGASYLRSVFKNFGAVTEMLTTKDPYNPVLLARFRGNPATAKKRKKILFYGHYDVVAADNATGKWIVDPFAMEGIDGYLYGRGTSDNKGPIMAAVFACAELTSEQALGSDIIFLIEGEEECGSRGFEDAVRASKDKIGQVDWILLANSYWLDDQIPCLTYGLRGVIHASVQIESTHPDLHSGVDGSSQLDEPLKDLVMLLSTLTGRDGQVMIPGFYDPIPQLSSEEEALYRDITAALVQQSPGLGDAASLAASLMRRWRDPTLTIHRFQTSGPDNNATIIPRLAKAVLSMRLVPNQEAGHVSEALVTWLEAQFESLGTNNSLTVTVDHMAEPWLGDWTNEIFKTLEEAVMDVWSPANEPQRRRSSSNSALRSTNGTGPLRVAIPEHTSNGHGSTTKPSPTTSSMLANSGLTSPIQPLTTLLEDTTITPPTKSTKSSASHKRSTSSATLTNATHARHEDSPPRRKPLYIREGGSIPAIRFLEKEFSAPAAHFPCGQASDSAHLDNERLRLVNLYKSKEIFKKVFRELPQK